MGTSYLGQMRSKVDNARAMFMCITFAILRVSQSARTSSPEFYSSSHVPPLLRKVGQVSTRALLFKDDQFVSVFLCVCVHSGRLFMWLDLVEQRAALYNLQAQGKKERLKEKKKNRDRTSVDETKTKSGLYSNSFTSSFPPLCCSKKVPSR